MSKRTVKARVVSAPELAPQEHLDRALLAIALLESDLSRTYGLRHAQIGAIRSDIQAARAGLAGATSDERLADLAGKAANLARFVSTFDEHAGAEAREISDTLYALGEEVQHG